MILSEDTLKLLLEEIKNKLMKIRYGRIIIDVRESSDVVDVITEERDRIEKNPLLM
jgi:hypothetical protein